MSEYGQPQFFARGTGLSEYVSQSGRERGEFGRHGRERK